MRSAQYLSHASSARPSPHSEAAIIDRLVGAGIRAEAITAAIDLLRTGVSDLIDLVVNRELTVERALRIARKRDRR